MPLTRSQLIMGNTSQGNVLPGQVQGVKPGGKGISIQLDGTIGFDAASCEGVVKTNNSSAFNSYIWPSAAPMVGGALTYNTGGVLSWNPVPTSGLGLGIDNVFVKVSIPISTSAPVFGEGQDEAMIGSLYFNSSSKGLFIRSSSQWEPVSQVNVYEQLLTGIYHLYVDNVYGVDTFIADFEDQQLVCGYTPQKPFKTISRASIEVARIQQGAGFNPLIYDRVVIHVAVGSFNVLNGKGSASVTPWVNNSIPTDAQLQAFNSTKKGGLILPRGVSVIGEDLRKSVIRPTFVPPFGSNYELDRASIFRITGGAFFFNFTFKDKEGYNESHHMLDCFSFVSEAELQAYYTKIQQAFDLPSTPIIANPGETEIVAPLPDLSPTTSTDGAIGSSPYVFNCSVRSLYGLCGINADGLEASGFRSIVVAQFTGVSLQKDLRCWERYDTAGFNWASDILSYDSGPNNYISISPNNIRMNQALTSYHIRAINNAFIQEVSVFAIGHGIHHWCRTGGDISITNSNSSFGGCAALAQGRKSFSFAVDQNWNVNRIRVRVNMNTATGNEIKKIFLGQITGNPAANTFNITLLQGLENSEKNPGVPRVLDDFGYSLYPNSYIWVENPNGNDFRAPLAPFAWNPTVSSNVINLASPFFDEFGNPPDNAEPLTPPLNGLKVYIRRVVDTKTQDERTYSLILSSTDSVTRTPLRDYVIETALGSPIINGPIHNNINTIIGESANLPPEGSGVIKRAQITLRRANPEKLWTPGDYYRPGETVRFRNKHFTCVQENSDLTFDVSKWDESYVHMPSGYNAEDYYKNSSPFIIFDNDTDGFEDSTSCGYNFNQVWLTDERVYKQLRTSTDYRGIHQFLTVLGFTPSEADNILLPRSASNRSFDPANASEMKFYSPNGAANSIGNWPVEFRRPSTIRMFGHAWEWAGFLNYTKAIPQYQKELSSQNKFTYYFTSRAGGRVYGSGFNEEGFLVTPQGIQDLTTGAVVSIDELGGETTINQPNSFENLTVSNLTVSQSATFNGTFESTSPIVAPNVYVDGTGLAVDNGALKVSIPMRKGPPPISTERVGARNGSLYWDTDLGCLFIRYNDVDSVQWVQAVPSVFGPGGASIIESEPVLMMAKTDSLQDSAEDWAYFPPDLDLSGAKSYLISKIDSKKLEMLEPSNFTVMEHLEVGTEIPEDVKNERGRVREWYLEAISRINSAKSKNALITAMSEISI